MIKLLTENDLPQLILRRRQAQTVRINTIIDKIDYVAQAYNILDPRPRTENKLGSQYWQWYVFIGGW